MTRARSVGLLLGLGVAALFALSLPALAQWRTDPGRVPTKSTLPAKPKRSRPAPVFAPNVVVLTFYQGNSAPSRASLERAFDLRIDRNLPSRSFVRYYIGPKALKQGVTVPQMCELLRTQPGVRSAEPDYAITKDQAPNDPFFGEQWALNNTGQFGGVVDADTDALEAWPSIPAGPDVKVAILDDGVQWNHADLAANIWSNPGEIAGNGIDDDGNGYVDDIRGWDTADNDNDPAPAVNADSHGTHVAGIAAAVSNNNTGIAGIARRVKLVPIRMYEGQAGWMSALAAGIDYARASGCRVVNVSYNIDGFTQFLTDAVVNAQNADIVYVNSAGNAGQNIDNLRGRLKQFASNVVFVANSTGTDGLSSSSNFGQTVDIAAPGDSIYSTIPGNGYDYFSGTSMATPQVAGALGAFRAMYPSLTYPQVIQKLRGSGDLRIAGGAVQNGRLNLVNLIEADSVAPSAVPQIRVTGRSSTALEVNYTTTGDDGTSGAAHAYEIRTSPNPITPANFAQAPVRVLFRGETPAGSALVARVPDLTPNTRTYLAIRARDNTGNFSAPTFFGPVRTLALGNYDDVDTAARFTPEVGSTWARTTEFAQSGTQSWTDSPGANYTNNANSTLTATNTFVATGPTIVRFRARLDLETGYDYLHVEFSTDGSTWNSAQSLTGTEDWQGYGAFLPVTNGQAVRIRFRLQTDTSVVLGGVWIDDIGTVAATQVFLDSIANPSPNWTAEAPWAVSNVRSFSPSFAWTDSPAGNYQSTTQILLRRNTPISLLGVADPVMSFMAWIDTETGYDTLSVGNINGNALETALTLSGTRDWTRYAVPIPADLTSITPGFYFETDGSVEQDGVYLDDVGIFGEALEAVNLVQATLTPESYVGNLVGRLIPVEVRNAGTDAVLDSFETVAQAGPNGSIIVEIPTTVVGNATIRIAPSRPFLSERIAAGVGAGVTSISGAIRNGDVNGDNAVTATDFAIVSSSFNRNLGDAGYDARADVNGSNSVNAADATIVRNAMRRRGA